MLLADLKDRYLEHAAAYYGESSHAATISTVLDALPDRLDVDGFTPERLKIIRDRWVKAKLNRTTINGYFRVAVGMFRWGVAERLVNVQTYQALKCVDALRAGRSEARETEKVGPVPQADIEAVLRTVAPPMAALIRLQLLTGARSGELLALRPCDVDVTGPVWTSTVQAHKEAWRGKSRILYFGPQAQEILRPLLLRPAEQRIWTYSTASYCMTVRRACVRAGVPAWHPHQLRHNAATEIRTSMGLEAAQVFLGHARADVTQVYAERDAALALTVAERR